MMAAWQTRSVPPCLAIARRALMGISGVDMSTFIFPELQVM